MTYRTEDIVVLEAIHSRLLRIAVIQAIVYKQENVYFLVYKYEAVENDFGFFETISNSPEDLSFVNAKIFVDFKPLVKHGTQKKFIFNTYHHVSVDCNHNTFS